MASSILAPVIYELHNLNTQSALSSLNSSSRTGLNSLRRDVQSSQTSIPLSPHVVPAPTVATQQQPLYNVLPTGRKVMILITASFMTLAATFSSTSLFPAAPEIAAEFGTTSERITLSNAAVLVAMGFASLIWTPVSSVLGRRTTYLLAILIFLVFSLGAAIAKDLTTFMAMRTLAGFEASFFMVAGQALIADIFVPAQRGTAVGFFLSGTVTGPALGPCVGGIIVTFASWRIIFWLQACMAGAALISAFFVVPSIPLARTELPTGSKIRHLFLQLNPMRVFRLWIYPNILLTDLACGALSWNMYSLLAAPRTLINPRFHLTSPLVSGLFYLAPGAGFLVGTTLGGKWADVTVRRHITKRGGLRVAQDRLNSGILAFFTLLPIATLVYGWSLEFIVGGLPLPTVSIFFSGLGLMLGFSSLNTYCTEVMPAKRMEVMAGKYMIQYICSAAGSAAVLPLINTIGVGWTCTMSAILVLVAGCLVLVCAKFGESMQRSVDDWLKPSGDRE